MFTQAPIGIENEPVFGALKAAIEAAFAPEQAEKTLRRLEKSKLRIREVERMLDKGLIPGASGDAYRGLGASDQGQLREFYLTRIEQVDEALRVKFRKLYSYY